MQGQPFQTMLNESLRTSSSMTARIRYFEAHAILQHNIRHHQVIEMIAMIRVKDNIAHAKANMSSINFHIKELSEIIATRCIVNEIEN